MKLLNWEEVTCTRANYNIEAFINLNCSFSFSKFRFSGRRSEVSNWIIQIS